MSRPGILVSKFQSRLSDLLFEFRDLHREHRITAPLLEIDLLQSTEEED